MTEKLNLSTYFSSPIYTINIPEWIDPLNKVSDPYILNAKKMSKDFIKTRDEQLEKKLGDFGIVHHSVSLLPDLNFREFKKYTLDRSKEILDSMGYNLKSYRLKFTELWVQEFPLKGGGSHQGHIHYNTHLSGFYFLKCSDKTSYPVFQDPRVAKLMSQLPLKTESEMSLGTSLVHLIPQPGTFVIFPSFLEHEFKLDAGIEPFRFIHFNVQAESINE